MGSEITEVLGAITAKRRTTDLHRFYSEITEVSVVFTDGWQHNISPRLYVVVVKQRGNLCGVLSPSGEENLNHEKCRHLVFNTSTTETGSA